MFWACKFKGPGNVKVRDKYPYFTIVLKTGMMWHLARGYALYAELFKRKGDLLKEKEKLNKAIEIFTECGADGCVDKYEKELASFS